MIKRIWHHTKKHAHHWKKEIVFMIELIKHDEVPKFAKFLVITLLSYLFSPIDLIPDFIPVFGHWDDILAIPLIMKIIVRITPGDLIQQVRLEIEGRDEIIIFTGKGPKIAAITIVILWFVVTYYTLVWLGFEPHFKF